jgi:hypothetical protein
MRSEVWQGKTEVVSITQISPVNILQCCCITPMMSETVNTLQYALKVAWISAVSMATFKTLYVVQWEQLMEGHEQCG